MALASTLCTPEGVRVCCEQTGSIPRHGRVGRGREWGHPLGWVGEVGMLTWDGTDSTAKFERPALKWEVGKEKEKVQQKLNKSLEQGLNLSGS